MEQVAVQSSAVLIVLGVGLLAIILYFTKNHKQLISVLEAIGPYLRLFRSINLEKSGENKSPLSSQNHDVDQVNYILVNTSEDDDLDWMRDLVSDGGSTQENEDRSK